MVFGGNHPSSDEVASLLGWWRDAGLDVLIDEEPRDWLARAEASAELAAAAPAAALIAKAPAPPVAPPAPSFPDTLAGFCEWLASTDRISIPLASRIAPVGDAASGLMTLIDLPEPGDVDSQVLFSGPSGALFDKMLSAIGRDRQSLYLVAMAPGWPGGGFVDKAMGALFVELARHHVALARPRALLLMGEQPSRAFLGMGFVEARGKVHDVALDGGAVRAVATFHPRTLLQHPEQKRRAWDDLQLLKSLLV